MRQQVLSLLFIALAAFFVGEAQITCTFCVECQAGYYFNSTYANSTYLNAIFTECQACAYPCATCNNLTSCTSCPSGYFLGPNSDCSIYWPNCETFDSDTFSCVDCFQGFYVNSTTGYCEPCPNNCAECNSSITCSSCSSTSLWNVTGDSTWYYYNLYYLASDGACAFVTHFIQGCVQYTSINGGCNLCSTGYSLVNSSSSCIKCPPNCEVCDSSGMCQQCRNGTYLNQTNSRCIYCPASCTSCINYTTCLTCSDYYGLDSNGRCSPCISGCKTCNLINDPLNCQHCITEYTYNPTTKTCDSCGIVYCNLCSYGIYQNSTKICLANSTSSSSSGHNSTNSSGSNQSSTNSSTNNQSSNNTNSSGSNQTSTNSSTTNQSSNSTNSSGSNQTSTNSSTTNQSSNNTNSSTHNQNSSNSSSSNQSNTNPSTVTITIINAAGTVISSNQLSIQSAAFTVLMFNGTSSVATNQSSPTVGVIVLNGIDTVILNQNSSSTSEASSNSSSSAYSSGVVQSSNDATVKALIIFSSILGAIQIFWLILHILSHVKLKKVQKCFGTATEVDGSKHVSSKKSDFLKFDDRVEDNLQIRQQLPIQADSPDKVLALENLNDKGNQNQAEATTLVKIENENSAMISESHSNAIQNGINNAGGHVFKLFNGEKELPAQLIVINKPQQHQKDNNYFYPRAEEPTPNFAPASNELQEQDRTNMRQMKADQLSNSQTSKKRVISEEYEEEKGDNQQKALSPQEKAYGKLPPLKSNNTKGKQEVANKPSKKENLIHNQDNGNNEDRSKSSLLLKKYNQNMLSQKQSEQFASQPSDEVQAALGKREDSVRLKQKETIFTHAKKLPASTESKADEEIKKTEGRLSPLRKNSQKGASRNSSANTGIYEVDLEQDQSKHNGIKDLEEQSGKHSEEEEKENDNPNYNWLFHRVVDDDEDDAM